MEGSRLESSAPRATFSELQIRLDEGWRRCRDLVPGTVPIPENPNI